MKNTLSYKIALSAILIAMAAALSYTERFIPLGLIVPLPGIKLGLANVVSMFALFFMGFKSAFIILVLRCLLTSFFGGFSSLMFSLAGGIMAVLIMEMLKRAKIFSIYGISIGGSVMHVTGQVLTSMVIMKSHYVLSYLPVLIISAVVTGALTALISAQVLKRMEKAVK
ncbi:MAG: Gx transporter family protein [Ruminococcaceae bacterium]|nr:Gx transporter family protein [Oscillospiraceae bacterium]